MAETPSRARAASAEVPEAPYAGLGPIIVFVATAMAILLLTRGDGSPAAGISAGLVLAAVGLGFLMGGYRFSLNGEWLRPPQGVYADEWAARSPGQKPHEGAYLGWMAVFIAFYVLFFLFSARSFAQALLQTTSDEAAATTELPVPAAVVVITATTAAALAFCSARYAAYIRTIACLKALLDGGDADARSLRRVRTAVFRDEQLFEPPGNIFITLGIMATFLGLSVGLVSLDLAQFLAPQSTGNGALSSLKSFVGCMGLALGMSMLGVVAAIAAQWLRGYGPSEATEQLIARCDTRLDPPDPAPGG